MLILAVVLAALAFLMTNVEVPAWSSAASALGILLFAVPSFWASKMWLGWRVAIGLFIVLGIAALVMEFIAIATAFPYGDFLYSDHLGFKLFDSVPWTVAFAWPPFVLGAYAIARNLVQATAARILVTSFLMVAFDLVLDPGAVYLGFWKYAGGGIFYGVPISNFAGWLLSGFAGAVLMELCISPVRPLLPTPVQLASSAAAIIFFWSALALFAGLFVPAIIGAVLLVVVSIVWRKYHYHFDDKIVFVDDNGTAIGTASKLDAHSADTQLHSAFSVFIFNPGGDLLLQQRALSKKTWPGVWSNSCCGHVMLHESPKRAAKRRLRDELGLKNIDLIFALPDFRYRAEKDGVVENEICPVFIGVTDNTPMLNPAEVAAVRWIDWDSFLALVNEPRTQISPWAVEEARLLSESKIFKNWLAARVASSRPAHV